MNGTLPESIWAIEQAALQNMVSAVRANPQVMTVEIEAQQPEPKFELQGNIAIIPIEGIMVKRASFWGSLFGETSTERVAAMVLLAMKDPSVKTILLRVDSPGGSVDGLAELGDAVWQARQEKRVIVQVTGTMASAAYYVGSQADAIYAQRMDMVGSIGTRAMLYDFSERFAAEGIKPIAIDTGWFKSAGAMGLEITDEQQAEFQRIVDGFYADFLKMIRRGRNMTQGALAPLADGRMFFADEAKANGLIDGVRTLADTVQKLSGGQRNRNRQRQALAT